MSFLRRLPSNTVKELLPRKASTRSGQAVVEYVILVTVVTLIFGTVFALTRQTLYKLWVCEVSARVQAPVGCGADQGKCWSGIAPEGSAPPNCGP